MLIINKDNLNVINVRCKIMNYNETLKEKNNYYQNLSNSFEFQSDIALHAFEDFKNNYIPPLILCALVNNENEVSIEIETEVENVLNDNECQRLLVCFGEDAILEYHLDLYSYFILGHFISKIPGMQTVYYTQIFMSFRISLPDLINYYYEELQRDEYTSRGR